MQKKPIYCKLQNEWSVSCCHCFLLIEMQKRNSRIYSIPCTVVLQEEEVLLRVGHLEGVRIRLRVPALEQVLVLNVGAEEGDELIASFIF